MIQVVIKSFGRSILSTDSRIEENSLLCMQYCEFIIQRWIRTWRNDLNKAVDKQKKRHYTRLGVQQSLISSWKGKRKKRQRKNKVTATKKPGQKGLNIAKGTRPGAVLVALYDSSLYIFWYNYSFFWDLSNKQRKKITYISGENKEQKK